VHDVLEVLRILRRVRVVTAVAVHVLRRYPDMSTAERIRDRIVAFAAHLVQGLGVQRNLVRGVRLMALQAIPLRRGVYSLDVEFLFHVAMTGQAQIGARRQKQRLQRRFVRIVALAALAADDGFMLAARTGQFLTDVKVAHAADLALTVSQHAGKLARVGVMAGQAFLFLEGRMKDVITCRGHQGFVALSAEIRALGTQKALVGSPMSPMAGRAGACLDRLMNRSLQELTLKFGMALVTQLVRSLGQHTFCTGPVGIVTRCTHV